MLATRYAFLFSKCNDYDGDDESENDNLNSNDLNVIESNDINKVNDWLYIGSKKARQYVDKYNIDYVISLGTSWDRGLYIDINSNIKEEKITIDDVWGADIVPEIHKCNKILERLKLENKKCLVHCNAGISRSSSIVIGYLMYSEKIRAVDAFNIVKKARKVTKPNNGFWSKLSNEYENFILNENYEHNSFESRS